MWSDSAPSRISSKSCTARVARSVKDCRIVVRGGDWYAVTSISSRPTTEISSGMRKPASWMARMAPMAMRSLAQNTPETGWTLGENRLHGVVATVTGPVAGCLKTGGGIQPHGGQGLAESFPPFASKPQLRRPADVGKVAVTKPQEMLSGHAPSQQVVQRDRWPIIALWNPIDRDKGNARRLERIQARHPIFGGDKQRTVDPALGGCLDVDLLHARHRRAC